ncbi:nuclear transport factor 2 family protein [Rhodobacter sp. 24-YEA-8]|uniref:nuclear transport factor 2 family protein n=1 Tax=Rhodobacter sp. 24-YEA-8 TaxID=1884310 RepID=UPI000894CBAB|nr:nuclear transport factor 2 family protein [Rhodobacter sp. 24-YEA-8]SED57768.1 hypothetical protein SAMN05519105_4201 [Rhodobacter sp. 24-YEA-8]
MSTETIDITRRYFAAVAAGDIPALTDLLAEDLGWHQPGRSSLSGKYTSRDAVFGLIGAFMQRSGGSFAIDRVGTFLANGDLVAATVHFRASREGAEMAMNGIDLLRIEGGRIREVWLFSEDQAAEDRFWG